MSSGRVPDRSLKVVTWNILNDDAAPWPGREPLLAAWLVHAGADLIALQECRQDSLQVEGLAQALNQAAAGEVSSRRWRALHYAHPDADGPRSIKSLAVLTHLEVAEVERRHIEVGDDIALRVSVSVGDARLDVVTTHLHYGPSAEGSRIRTEQAEYLLGWLSSMDGPLVLAGDMNAQPGGRTMALLKAQFRSAYAEATGREPAWTHPTPLVQSIVDVPAPLEQFRRAIDYVLIRGPLRAGAAGLLGDDSWAAAPPGDPSDHLGLWATVALE